MFLYEVSSSALNDSDNGAEYHGTLKSAMKQARELASWMRDKEGDHDVMVDRVELADTKKETIVALANHRGWCSSRKRLWPKGVDR